MAKKTDVDCFGAFFSIHPEKNSVAKINKNFKFILSFI